MKKIYPLILLLGLPLLGSHARAGGDIDMGVQNETRLADTVFYRFLPGNPTLFAFVDNTGKLDDFSKQIASNIGDILSGRTVIVVNGYSNSLPTEQQNLDNARTRSNHVKSWFIVRNGLAEQHFQTQNHARSWRGMDDVVAIVSLRKAGPAPESPPPAREKPQTPPPAQPSDNEVQTKPTPQPEPAQIPPTAVAPVTRLKSDTPVLAVKTNLLYWAGVMPDFRNYSFLPNIEVEWYFKNRWSLAGTGAWIKNRINSSEYFGLTSWSLEPRFWFSNNGRYNGFYVGAYGQMGDFDNQNMHIDNFGQTGDFFGGGLSLGAYIPFSRSLGFELGIRAGYQRRETDYYSARDCGQCVDYTLKSNEWGVTGIKASLVYRFLFKKRY